MVKMFGYKCFVLLYSHLGLGKEPPYHQKGEKLSFLSSCTQSRV